MKHGRHFLTLAAVIGVCGYAVAQTSSYARQAQNLVMNKLESDWGERVRAQWLSTDVRRINSDLVKVAGKGVAARVSDSGRVHFSYLVTMYPRTRKASIVTIDLENYEDVGLNAKIISPRNDASYRARARVLAEREVERQLGRNLNVTFNGGNVYTVKNNQRAVTGTGSMWSRDKSRRGSFNYTVLFDARTGRNLSTQVRVTAKPG
jgi:hypothetical protein